MKTQTKKPIEKIRVTIEPKPLTKEAPAEEEKPVEVTEEETIQPEQIDEKGTGVELRDITMYSLFPVLYKYYDKQPVGTVRIKNFEKSAVKQVSVQFFVERYMDNPMEIISNLTLQPDEEKIIDLYGLFTEEMMDITEGTKASAKITLNYRLFGKKTVEYTPILELHNRNALVWDDDRKIASFITAKDPDVLNFAKNVVSWMQEAENPYLDENLQKGMALFEGIKAFGIRYSIDPTTPFSEFSADKTAIDFLQFPKQTLQYSNGDCDDLSALYTALLESVGVESAVITIPGHIFTAFALKMSPDEARKVFSRPDELIFINEKVWVPVEITLFQESFDKAWMEGAKEWRENESRGQSSLYPTRTSWMEYQAVGYREGSTGSMMPDKEKVIAEFEKTVTRHVEKEIYPQIAAIQGKMAKAENTVKYKNQLAVLYARYGLYEKALDSFLDIIEQREYTPALTNIGNIYFLKENYEKAMSYYNRVLRKDEMNKTALLGISRCNHELENYGLVSKTYEKLKEVDADLALRFAYLDLKGTEATRAADAAGLRHTVVWEEEE